jgi:hypothetical protein
MARSNRWLIAGSLVASTLAGSSAQACWLTGCCGGAPKTTTFYAPVAPVVPAVPNPCNTCAPVNPCATTGCNTCAAPTLAAAPTTFAQPTTALMPVTPVTAYRPGLFGGLFSGSSTQPIATTLPYTAGYAPAAPYTVGYTPLAAPAWTTAPYTSYRPVAVAPVSYAVPAAPVTVQYAPQPVAQATYYAPSTTTTVPTTTYMPTTTATPAPVTTSAPGCNCHSSTTVPSTSGQYWTPNTNGAVVSSAPVSNGTITSGTITNGTTSSGAVMTSGSTTTFGNSNLGSQGVIQQSAPQQAPANTDNNVKPIEDPIKKSSTTTPGYEDPRNKTALMPLIDHSQVVETKVNNAPMVRSLEELAPFNPVRMTSHAR